jgi:WD40 repeat protein
VYGLKLVSNEILASGSADYSIKLWNITSGRLIRTIMGSSQIYFSVDILNDASTILSGSYDYNIRLWNMSSGSLLKAITTGVLIETLTVLNPIFTSANANTITTETMKFKITETPNTSSTSKIIN